MYMMGFFLLSAKEMGVNKGLAYHRSHSCSLLVFVGCSTAMSSSLRTFSWDRSLSSLISRRAVMGNCEIKFGQRRWRPLFESILVGVVTYTILLMMHNNLLQCDRSSRFTRSRAVDFSKCGRNPVSRVIHQVLFSSLPVIPECAFTKLPLQFIIGNARAANKATLVPHVVERKSPRGGPPLGRELRHNEHRCAD